MDNWRDLMALYGLLRTAYEKVQEGERRDVFTNVLQKQLEFPTSQAQLYTSIVLGQNTESSADWVKTNGLRVIGSWVRGEQQGNVGGWLSTMKETWQFNDNLTYARKIERYDQAITTGPFFQSSYSRPRISVEEGIWAPPDTTVDELKLFIMSTDGSARSMTFEWVEKEKYNYRACSINGQRFSRE
jgi:hypothetical protein